MLLRFQSVVQEVSGVVPRRIRYREGYTSGDPEATEQPMRGRNDSN